MTEAEMAPNQHTETQPWIANCSSRGFRGLYDRKEWGMGRYDQKANVQAQSRAICCKLMNQIINQIRFRQDVESCCE